MIYTYNVILEAWEDYKRAKAFCVLRNGKWTNVPLVDGRLVPDFAGATQTRLRDLKDVMDFPEYLEFYWKKEK